MRGSVTPIEKSQTLISKSVVKYLATLDACVVWAKNKFGHKISNLRSKTVNETERA